ncbi:hypothetical protein GGR51DRAFT_521084 [Nemania sp. FL0031]|nr:hypothetical protein GGR51DRAFT_521084 [Nemania sp. FL0031]
MMPHRTALGLPAHLLARSARIIRCWLQSLSWAIATMDLLWLWLSRPLEPLSRDLFFYHGFTLHGETLCVCFLGISSLPLFRYFLFWFGVYRNRQTERTRRFHLRGSAQGIGISNFYHMAFDGCKGCKGKHCGVLALRDFILRVYLLDPNRGVLYGAISPLTYLGILHLYKPMGR